MDIVATFLWLLDNRRQLKDFAFERAWPVSPGRTCRGYVATSVQLLDVALSCRDSAKPVTLLADGSALVMPMEMIPGSFIFWNQYPRAEKGLTHGGTFRNTEVTNEWDVAFSWLNKRSGRTGRSAMFLIQWFSICGMPKLRGFVEDPPRACEQNNDNYRKRKNHILNKS